VQIFLNRNIFPPFVLFINKTNLTLLFTFPVADFYFARRRIFWHLFAACFLCIFINCGLINLFDLFLFLPTQNIFIHFLETVTHIKYMYVKNIASAVRWILSCIVFHFYCITALVIFLYLLCLIADLSSHFCALSFFSFALSSFSLSQPLFLFTLSPTLPHLKHFRWLYLQFLDWLR